MAKTAADLLPKLDDLGLKLMQTGKPTTAQPGQDIALAQYQKDGTPAINARIEISMLPSLEVAVQTYGALSVALQNPPQDLFGQKTQQKDAPATGAGDQQKSYVTATPDGQGNYVWTDAYRMGRAFVIVYTMGQDSPDVMAVRKQIAERMAARAPR